MLDIVLWKRLPLVSWPEGQNWVAWRVLQWVKCAWGLPTRENVRLRPFPCSFRKSLQGWYERTKRCRHRGSRHWPGLLAYLDTTRRRFRIWPEEPAESATAASWRTSFRVEPRLSKASFFSPLACGTWSRQQTWPTTQLEIWKGSLQVFVCFCLVWNRVTFLELRSCVSRVRASVRILLLNPNIRKKGLTKNWFVENGTNAGQSLLQVGEVNEICKNKMEEMKCPKDLQLWYKNKCTSETGWQYSNQAKKKTSCKMTKHPGYKDTPSDCLLEKSFKGQLQKKQTLLGHYFEYKKKRSEVACHGITKWIKQPKDLIAKGTIKPFSEAVDLNFDQLGFWNFKEWGLRELGA